jgi:hypothetical protein
MKKIIETIIKYCNVFFFKEGSEKLPKSWIKWRSWKSAPIAENIRKFKEISRSSGGFQIDVLLV